MKDSYELLQQGDVLAILVVLATIVVALAKGVFALNKNRSQTRKEFLDGWGKTENHKDSFWLEMLVMHGLGRICLLV